MDLSIIVPCHNSEKYIRKCLNSIISQTKKKIKLEVLVVNDCSKDNTKKILNDYQKKINFIKIITNQKNLGVSKSRNLALKKALGKYILFLDSDDELIDKTLENLISQLKKEKSDVIVLKSKQIGEKKIDQNQIYTTKKSKELIKNIKNFNKFRATCWNFALNRKFIINKKIFFKDFRIFEDQFYVTKILFEEKSFSIFKKPIYNRRLDEPKTLSKIVGFDTALTCLKLIIEISSLFLNQKKKFKRNKIYKNFFISRIKFLENLFLENLLICTNSQIKNFSNLYFKYKLLLSKVNLISFQKNLQKYKDKKIHSLLTKLNKQKKYHIFCSWYYSEIIIKICLKYNYRIDYILDNNLSYRNKKLFDKKIIFPSDLNKSDLKSHSVLLCNKDDFHIKKISIQLKNMGFNQKDIIIPNI